MKEKSLDKRVKEAIEIRTKLAQLGLPPGDPDVVALRERVNDFVRGVGWTGTVFLNAYGRAIMVKLSMQDHVQSVVFLKGDRR